MKKRRKFGKKFYTLDGCSTTKTGANKKKNAARKKGKNARVVSGGGKHCVYTRG